MTAIADAAPRVARPTHQGLSHPDAFAPLYEKVRSELEAIALERPLTDTTSLPPEPKLMEQFGVSRGTLRRAIDELVRDGLLNAEQGRGTYVNQEERIRRVVWNRLANVALPDSRFHLDLRHFVPDFTGRSRADARVVKQSAWTKADTIFLMPDNSTRALRHKALLAGKRILVPTFGFRRGLVVLDGATIPDADKALASTLDGMEQIGERFGVELKGTPVVGDGLRDLQAGALVGCEPHLVLTGKGAPYRGLPLPEPFPLGTVVHENLAAFAEWLIQRHAAPKIAAA